MKAMPNLSTTRTAAKRFVAALALTPLLALVLAACGGADQGVNPVPPPTPKGNLAACDAQHLRILVDPSAAQPAVPDGTYLPIDFVNTSGKACRIAGYPHVVAMTPTGRHNAVASHRHVRGVGGPLLLAPDYTAHAWLLIADMSGGKGAGCRSFNATGLRVGPPGAHGWVWVDWPLRLCVPQKAAVLTVQEVQAGLANATTFP